MNAETSAEGPASERNPQGLDPALLIAPDYVLVRMALVDKVGLPAALVLQRIHWRCEIRPEGWPATIDEICDDTHLGKAQVKAALKRLRGLGWLTSRRASSWDPTQVWSLVMAPTSREGENRLHEGSGIARTSERKSPPPPIEDLEDFLDNSSPQPPSRAKRRPTARSEEEAIAEKWVQDLPWCVDCGKDLAANAAELLRGQWTPELLEQQVAAAQGAGDPAAFLVFAIRNALPGVAKVMPPRRRKMSVVSGIAAAVEGAGTAVVETEEDRQRKLAKIAAWQANREESS